MAVKIERWVIAQKKYKLSDKHVQMARELGLNPDKLGKINNHKQETWKAPLPQFIEDIYFKRFKREEPLTIYSLTELLANNQAKKEKRKMAKNNTSERVSFETHNVGNGTHNKPLSIAAKIKSYMKKPKVAVKLESGESTDSILHKECHFFDDAFNLYETECVTLSQLGFTLKKIHPKYNPRRYGCKTLREIYEKLDGYEIIQSDDVSVKRSKIL